MAFIVINDPNKLYEPDFLTDEEIGNNPIHLSEIRARRYYIVDRAQVRNKDSVVWQEANPLNILPYDKPKNVRLGWNVYEEIGMAVISQSTRNIKITEVK